MAKLFNQILTSIAGFVWGVRLIVLILAVGVFLTIRVKGLQIRLLPRAIKELFVNEKSGDSGEVSSFAALCTALSATIGTGNIVGVASALVAGGPGAIFWMWIVAFFGMMTNYSENVLGIYYRRKNFKGEWSGGAMYYLKDGLGSYKGCKQIGAVLAVLFSAFCLLASFGIGNMSQVNSIAANMTSAFSIPATVTGIVLVIIGALVIVGGLKRIAAVTEKLVPFMAIAYVIGALVIFFANIGHVGAVFTAIFKGAFGLRAVGGGIVGSGVKLALTWGMKRGVFSNEAGLGSTPHAHALAKVKQPQDQGALAIIGVFVDTFVILTLTALVLITSGLIPEGMTGTALTQAAFSLTFGSFGKVFIAICMLFFAFSTILGWYFFGQVNFNALFGSKYTKVYSLIVVLFILIGSSLKVDLVWALADFFNGLMAVPNLLALLALSGVVAGIARNKKD